MYQYDEQGRMVRSVTQSEWTAEDRALMLARQQNRNAVHQRCGHEKAKAFHPDNEGWYEADETVVCWACTAMDQAEDPQAGLHELRLVHDRRDYEANPLPPLLTEEERAAARAADPLAAYLAEPPATETPAPTSRQAAAERSMGGA